MDREIPVEERRRRTLRRVAFAAPVVVACGALLLWLPALFSPTLSRTQVRTAKVERGRLEAVVEGSGTVVPAFERSLPSPLDARVLRILKHPGDAVAAGDPVLDLDTSAARLDVERLEDRLAGKRNEAEQLRLALERELLDLQSRLETGRLDREVLQARVARQRKLAEDGLVSAELLAETEVSARKADIDLAQLTATMAAARRQTDTRLAGTALEVATLAKEVAEARRQLELATARADAAGIVTWVVDQEGAAVRRGDVLARIARLDAFRVDATASDVHARRIAVGAPVRVPLDGRVLAGRVASVYPAIEQGTIRFAVELQHPSDPALRQNLRLDVHVVDRVKEDVLCLPRGIATGTARAQQVFVVHGNRATRTRVVLGQTGAEAVEVLEGLREGDEVVISDMQDYEHVGSVKLR
ncbi:MAG TPA: HlyD family efflux transporter periplasmic adaptor subunit [Candidatus Polarisedimenticolaceae bacterium]|nr:HlyD family efflux transporter periplasmic adaptor subunit [Candidatus Polarisedimenticolaceae bacterium]